MELASQHPKTPIHSAEMPADRCVLTLLCFTAFFCSLLRHMFLRQLHFSWPSCQKRHISCVLRMGTFPP